MRFWQLQIDLWPACWVLVAAAFAIGAMFVVDGVAKSSARKRTQRALLRALGGSSAE